MAGRDGRMPRASGWLRREWRALGIRTQTLVVVATLALAITLAVAHCPWRTTGMTGTHTVDAAEMAGTWGGLTDENGVVTSKATVREVLETFYLGRNTVIWIDDLPCSDVRAYALPAEVLVAWCLGPTGQPYMTDAGANEAWNDLAEADRRNWIASAFALRRLIAGGITEDDAGTVWREYRWA